MQSSNRKSRLIFFVFLAVVLIYGFWEYFVRNKVRSNGVYTKCFVEEVYSYKGGVRIEIMYHYKGNKYTSLLNSSSDAIKVDDQYIIMLLPENPKTIVFEYKKVPDCLLNLIPPPEGWERIPTCR